MTHGSLFAGIGGFDLGFERAGIKTIWAIEKDKYCRRILQTHFAGTQLYGDITKVNPSHLEAVDIISAGFPCQDLSVAGKREGLKGERSGLFFEIVRFLEALRPSWVVLENVPGLLSSNRGRDFAIVLSSLAQCGYGVSWRILDSQFFGVPQRRRRVFIVGNLGRPCPPEILFESESGRGNTQKGRKAGRDATAYAVRRSQTKGNWQNPVRDKPSLGGTDYAIAYDALNNKATEKAPTLGQNTGQATGRAGVVAFNPQSGGSKPRLGIGDKPTALHAGQTPAIVHAVIEENTRDELRVRQSHPSVSARWGGKQKPWVVAYDAYNERLTGEKTGILREQHGTNANLVCQTTDANGVREASGIPRRVDYPDSPRYRALGNAVTVNVAEWIGRRLAQF